jgi:uncharacterized protein YecE (DUF72 family)
MGRILIGTTSWADPGLTKTGLFYPAEVKTPSDRLRYYASSFPIAELDSAYHFMPTRRNLSLWLDSTPSSFVFDIRAFSLFTGHPTPLNSLPRPIREAYGDAIEHKGNLYEHHLPAEAIEALWARFRETLEIVDTAGKLGSVLFQFPPWFHPRDDTRERIRACRERLPGYRLAVEFRTPDWLGEAHREETLAFLREHQLSLVCVDEPQGLKSSVPPVAEVTASPAVVRFHGRNTEAWEVRGIPAEERFRYLYSQEELEEWVPRILVMAAEAEQVHVIFKNKYQDFPIRNARQLMAMLG